MAETRIEITSWKSDLEALATNAFVAGRPLRGVDYEVASEWISDVVGLRLVQTFKLKEGVKL